MLPAIAVQQQYRLRRKFDRCCLRLPYVQQRQYREGMGKEQPGAVLGDYYPAAKNGESPDMGSFPVPLKLVHSCGSSFRREKFPRSKIVPEDCPGLQNMISDTR